MRLIHLNEIQPILENKPPILAAIKQSFILHAQGKIDLPDPVQMLFRHTDDEIRGDCHVKTASAEDLPYFCIKVATGFYANPEKGLPVNDGLVLLMSTETGKPIALFQDEGQMTSRRTAAAGALAASLSDSDAPKSLGVVGTGHQAELQARWIAESCTISTINIWGRATAKAQLLKEKLARKGMKVKISHTISHLCERSDIIVTTTPSSSPLVLDSHIKPGHHIIAIGSDSPGKIELDPNILKRAHPIITDDVAQCLHHGEFGHAVRAGLIKESHYTPLGHALQNPKALSLDDNSISVVDLTGLGAQDLAVASLVYDSLQG